MSDRDETLGVLDASVDTEQYAGSRRSINKLVEQYGEEAEQMQIYGIPLSALTREELKAVIAFQGTYIRDVHEIRARQRALMRGLRSVSIHGHNPKQTIIDEVPNG